MDLYAGFRYSSSRMHWKTQADVLRTSGRTIYLIQFGLLAGEGEREPHRKLLVFDVAFFHEVAEALRHMVKQLEQEREAVSRSAQRPRGFLHQPTLVPVP